MGLVESRVAAVFVNQKNLLTLNLTLCYLPAREFAELSAAGSTRRR